MTAIVLVVWIATTVADEGRPPHPPPAERCFAIDFAPVTNLRKSAISHWVIFLGKSADGKPIEFQARFRPDKTPTEIRDAVFEVVRGTKLNVKKVGDTKLMISDCQSLRILTEMPPKREFPVDARPTLDSFKNEEEALKQNKG